MSIQQQLINKGQGGGQPNISAEILKRTRYPLLPLETQQQIVTVLDKAQNIIDKRKASLQLLDQLLRDTFLDLFGDPVSNPKKWPKEICENLFEMKLGKMLSAKNYKGTHLRKYLRNVNVKWGEIDLSDLNEMDFTDKELENYSLRKGDILVCEGGEVGRTAILSEDLKGFGFQNALHRLRIKDASKINHEYFFSLMNIGVGGGLIKRETIAVTIQHFTLEKFKQLQIPVAPPDLQIKFKGIAEKHLDTKKKLKESLSQSETLFQSLLQKAFSEEGITINRKELAIQNKLADVYEANAIFDILPIDLLPKREQAAVQQVRGRLNTFLGTKQIFKTQTAVDKALNKHNLDVFIKHATPDPGNTFSNIGGGYPTVPIKNFTGKAAGELYGINTSGAAPYGPAVQVTHNFVDLLRGMNIKSAGKMLLKLDTDTLPGLGGNKAAVDLSKLKRKGFREIKEKPERPYDKLTPKIEAAEAKKEGAKEKGKEQQRQPGKEFDALEYITRIFPNEEFSMSHFEASLDSPMYAHLTIDDMKAGVFKAIDGLIKNNLENIPVTFEQLKDKLKEKLFNPVFDLLHEYVMEKLDDESSSFTQVYFDEQLAQVNTVAYTHLITQRAERRIYLLLNNYKTETAP